MNRGDSGQRRFQLIWAAAAYLVLSVLIMGANPLKGETLAPMGLLGKYPGWSAHPFTSPSSHPERSDVLDVFLPSAITLKGAIRSGEPGLWNPVSGNGNSGILKLSGAKLTPSYLGFVAVEEHWLGFYFASLLKLVIAGTGGFLFLRLFLGAYPSFFGGAIFALSGFNAAWFHWPHVATSAWIPWVLWTCAGWYLFRRRRWLLGMAAITAMLILGGFPAVAAYGLAAAVLLAAVLTVPFTDGFRDALRMAASAFAAIAIGFLLVAIPLLALAEMVGMVDMGYRRGGTDLNFPAALALLINPFADGLPKVEYTLYSGWIALALALVAPVLVRGKLRTNGTAALLWYGAFLLTGSIAAAFGLFPHELLRVIPVVGSSLWSRFSVLVGLAIAILAAVSADRVMAYIRQRSGNKLSALVVFFLAGVASYQIYGQAALFRTFNSVASAGDFYPLTPTIKHVQDNLGVTQSVVADQGYVISGTLGAYGIPEWFSHGLKTNAEKVIMQQLVDEPFQSATAAMFPANAIKLDGDLYARLGIRFVLMSHGKYKLLHRQPPLERKTSPPMPQNRLAQSLSIDRPMSVSAIGMVFDTYGAKQAPAEVFLELSDSGGQVLARALLGAEHVKHKRKAIFRFGRSVDLAAGAYELRLGLAGNGKGRPLGVLYSGKAHHPGEAMRVNMAEMPGAMLYSLYGSAEPPAFDPAWWRLVDIEEEKITTLENLRAPKGAYMVRDLSADAAWTEKGVVTSRPRAERMVVHYSGDSAGYIILPVRFYPGWNAYVNGAQGMAQSYLGVMPAVKVDGPAEIEWVYEPAYIAKGGALMLGALPLLFLMLRLAPSRQPAQAKPTKKTHETHHPDSLL